LPTAATRLEILLKFLVLEEEGMIRATLLVLFAFSSGAALAMVYPEGPRTVLQTVGNLSSFVTGGEAAKASQGEQPPEQPAIVSLATATSEDVPRRIQTIGDAVASESVTLTPRISGRVQSVLFEGGETVEAGSLIVQLDPAEVEAEHRLAQAQLEEISGAAERASRLAGTGAGPRSAAEDLMRREQAAQAAVDSAGERLKSFEIRAPFSGRLGLRTVSVGALVQPGDAIVLLDAVDPIDVRFAVPERFLADLRPGAEVIATSTAFPDQAFTGSIRLIEPRVDPVLRMVRVEAQLLNPDGRLVPGKLLSLDVTLGAVSNAVTVPAVAVRTEASVQFVFREANGRAERVLVETGQRLADRIVITKGLQPGDRVVFEGLVDLSDGALIGEANPEATEGIALETAVGS
jgi:membrane fusion protein (multidrug efflux system)